MIRKIFSYAFFIAGVAALAWYYTPLFCITILLLISGGLYRK